MISSPYEEEVPMRLTCCNLGHGGRPDWLGATGDTGGRKMAGGGSGQRTGGGQARQFGPLSRPNQAGFQTRWATRSRAGRCRVADRFAPRDGNCLGAGETNQVMFVLIIVCGRIDALTFAEFEAKYSGGI